jgi:hypothetical protein
MSRGNLLILCVMQQDSLFNLAVYCGILAGLKTLFRNQHQGPGLRKDSAVSIAYFCSYVF